MLAKFPGKSKGREKMTKKDERRQYPRVYCELPLKLAANGFDFATSTQNVSAVGAYCRINKYLPPFTKLAVRLSLPVNRGDQSDTLNVECKGVVVRSEDETSGGFNIAIFFNEIKDSQRQKIEQYISKSLP